MSAYNLARRLRVQPATIAGIEQSEARGTISLNTLSRVADALDCKLMYALVPVPHSLDDIVRDQARKLAERTVTRVAHTMNLEKQTVDRRFREREIKALTDELVRTLPRDLWRPLL